MLLVPRLRLGCVRKMTTGRAAQCQAAAWSIRHRLVQATTSMSGQDLTANGNISQPSSSRNASSGHIWRPALSAACHLNKCVPAPDVDTDSYENGRQFLDQLGMHIVDLCRSRWQLLRQMHLLWRRTFTGVFGPSCRCGALGTDAHTAVSTEPHL